VFFDTRAVPTRRELQLDLLAFLGTLVAAIVQGWRASDIIWASWIASLLTGLSFFLILSFKMLQDYTSGGSAKEPSEKKTGAGKADKDNKVPQPMEGNPGCLCLAISGVIGLAAWLVGPGIARIILLLLIGINVVAMFVEILAPRGWLGLNLNQKPTRALFYTPTALFLVFFFLIHFGGFHAGHAFFLSFFVPLGIEFEVTGAILDSLRENTGIFFDYLVWAYWPYMLSVAVKNAEAYRSALNSRSKQGVEMILPYKNVVRIHILIFVLIPVATMGSNFALTLVALMFFYFPVESVVAWYKAR